MKTLTSFLNEMYVNSSKKEAEFVKKYFKIKELDISKPEIEVKTKKDHSEGQPPVETVSEGADDTGSWTIKMNQLNDPDEEENKLKSLKRHYGDFRSTIGKANKEFMMKKSTLKESEDLDESFKVGNYPLKNGKSYNLSSEDVFALNKMFESTKHKTQLLELASKSEQDLKGLIEFAKVSI